MCESDDGDGPQTVTRDSLLADLRALGVERGDDLIVHSSLSSLGWVEGGAETVVDALVAAVDTGTVVVPTFTFGTTDAEGAPFDPDSSPSHTGAVTEALRTRPDSVRSHHPTHAVGALGADACEIAADHALEASLGADSPLHRVCRRGGRVLLLGVDHTSNSALHVAESLADLPFKRGTRRVWTAADGDPREVDVARVGCSQGFGRFGVAADALGLPVRGEVGAATAQLLEGRELLELAGALLAADPGVLLCDDTGCWWCPEARAVLSDHDPRYRNGGTAET